MTQALINLDLVLVYNGSSTFFRDDQLLPYTEYEYQVGSNVTCDILVLKRHSIRFSFFPPPLVFLELFFTLRS